MNKKKKRIECQDAILDVTERDHMSTVFTFMRWEMNKNEL